MKILRDLPVQVASALRQNYGALIREDDEIVIEAIGAPAVVKPGYAAIKNTMMRVRIGDIKTWIEYDRLDGQAFLSRFTNPACMTTGMVITKPVVATTHDVLDDFNTFMANPFKPNEIVDEPLVINADNTITIKFTPECVWFTGQYLVKLQNPTVLVEGRPVVAVTAIKGDFDACNALTGMDAYSPGMLTYDVDYSEFTDELLSMAPTSNWEWSNTPIDTPTAVISRIAAILASKDPLPWNNTTSVAKPYNLFGGGIIYNGPSEDVFNQLVLNYGGTKFQGGPGFLSEDMRRARLDFEYVLVYATNGKYGFGDANYDMLFMHYGKRRDPATIDGPERPPVHHWPLKFQDRRNYGVSDVPCGLRGSWMSYQDRDYPLFVLCGARPVANTIGVTQLAGCSLFGVDMPCDRDFTFSTRLRIHGNQQASAVTMLWGKALEGNKRGTFGTFGATNVNLGGNGWGKYHENPATTIRPYPHWLNMTVVRRGEDWFIYYDGRLSQITKGTHEVDVINMLYSYYADQYITIEDIYYFDYGMSGKQVRKMLAKEYDIDRKFPVVPAPEPIHHWPLNGVLENLGTSKTPINGVFDWKLYDGEKWGARVNAQGGQSIGVSLDISKDFTFQFDYIPATDAGGSGILCGENVTTQSDGALKSSNGIVYVNGGHGVHDSTVERFRPGVPVRWTIVRKGDYYFTYVNGQLDRATNRGKAGLTTVINAWTHFGRSFDYMHNGDLTRNWKYWDSALSPDQVFSEAYKV